MKIINISNPDKEPKHGDLLRYEYPNGDFVEKQYFNISAPTGDEKLELDNQIERSWRNAELASTDFIVPLTDHPKHEAYMTYRQELRDYPSQPDFPNGERPIKP